MTDYDYSELLKSAKEKLPKGIAKEDRFKVPEIDLFVEGKSTVFRNFADIAEAIRREPGDLLAYFQRELGTPGIIEGRRAVFKSRLIPQQVDSRLKTYVNSFVICSECKRPDTHIVKEGRTDVLECEACGARRPIGVRKSTTSQQAVKAVEANKVYEVMIQDVGKKGDGIAKIEDYIIYIPGTAKGSVVKIKITKVMGKMAFATIHNE
ncbi:MAG: translation initiation factor IF-2 subunit beta [Thermoplasmata archaeon]|nr:translation initiation factor IF-2 subunit beta [Thermoplasmata archaeon]